jgi:hypothetical protein
MTTDEFRTAVATALSTVDGVKGYAKRPGAINVGDGWPRWGGGHRDVGAIAFEETWHVIVAAPGDEDTATEWCDAHRDALFAALSPLLYITALEPALLPMAGTDTYALQITGTAE